MTRLHLAAPIVAVLSISVPTGARADVKTATDGGFLIETQVNLKKAPAAVYAALGQVGRWWSDDHTFSGKARNLSLSLSAGACFCERWREGGQGNQGTKDNSVEHGRVVAARSGQMLRLQSALGPLQEMALIGILTFALDPGPEGSTNLKLTYRVRGADGQGLDKLAPAVDGVLTQQVARFGRFVETGKPE